MSTALGLPFSLYPADFNPNCIAGLVDWHDPGYGVTLSSGYVSEWLDRTGAATHALAQGTQENRPLYSASDAAYGNRPTVTFDGDTDSLTSGTWGAGQAPPFTIYLVGHVISTAVYNAIVDLGEGSSYYNLWSWDRVLWLYGSSFVNTSLAIATPSVMCVAFDSTDSYAGVNTTSVATVNPGLFFTPFTKMRFGVYLNGGDWTNCVVAYFLLYSGKHSEGNRTTVMRALGERFGITIT